MRDRVKVLGGQICTRVSKRWVSSARAGSDPPSRSGVTYRVTVTCSSTRDRLPPIHRAHSAGFRPNAGKSSALNVVISAISPASMRMTSSLNARNWLSPGRRR